MRVLHLVSNEKLTGPVDPAIRLARALLEQGVDSRIAVGRPAEGRGPIDDLVRERGLEPITALRLQKHRRLFAGFADVRRLQGLLAADAPDVLHAHLDNAHGIALRARRRFWKLRPRRGAGSGPILVRSLYDDSAAAATRRYRRLFGPEVDGVFVFSEAVRGRLLERFGLPADRVVTLAGAVLADRFRPRAPGEDLRDRFDIPRDAVVVGIVARIQRHRRYPVLFEAMRKVMDEFPDVYLLVLGRGTHAQEIAQKNVKRLAMEERTRLPGYVGGDDYPAALASFDIKVFLVPGSDGTCRAVREAMACGIPTVVARRGMLPEIVRDGVDGFVIDDDVRTLAAAIGKLAADADLRRKMGASALERAREEFSQQRQARRVRDAYEHWLQVSD